VFSLWDPEKRDKYIDEPERWDAVQTEMRRILVDLKVDFTEEIGEAAFYGPKLDIQIRNVYGKEDTLITIQVDFLLAEKWGMEYVDSDGQKKHPYVIHRTSIGCYERTLALLIEKYAGALPMWLSPTQVAVLPLTERHLEYARSVNSTLLAAGIRSTIDERNEKIGYKIREAQLQKTPYMLILGDKEAETTQVSVRHRSRGDLGSLALEELLQTLQTEIQTKAKT
jgi:threonyl-tRNA synthetase